MVHFLLQKFVEFTITESAPGVRLRMEEIKFYAK